MKKLGMMILALALLLSGCLAAPVYETLDGLDVNGNVPAMKKMVFDLPEDASVQTVQGTAGRIYFCDGYEIMVETFSAGDLDKTLRNLTGFSRDALTLVQTKVDGIDRYSCVWTSIGENGEQVGRTTILDDGGYHYCLTVTAPAEDSLKLQPVFGALFESFTLESA
ncbi:MAG: hypothetical protein J6A88_09490 [Oscillospiraceae bacterium]|nr:hypothetical protein [Oscillospiraceae bacterium]